MKFSIDATSSYNSIHPTYLYTERFNNNVETYHEGTKWFGIFLAFVSGAFFTLSASLVKAIKTVHPMILLSIRAILQIVVMMIAAAYNSQNLFGPKGQRILVQFQVRLLHYNIYVSLYYKLWKYSPLDFKLSKVHLTFLI